MAKLHLHFAKKILISRKEKKPELLSEISRDIHVLKDFGAQGLAERIEIFLLNYPVA